LRNWIPRLKSQGEERRKRRRRRRRRGWFSEQG